MTTLRPFSSNRPRTSLRVLLVEANQPLVREGGNSLYDLREDIFDAADATVSGGKATIVSVYDIATSGGEPYALWD